MVVVVVVVVSSGHLRPPREGRGVFPVEQQIFPVPIYVICDYYIHKTDLADLSSLKNV